MNMLTIQVRHDVTLTYSIYIYKIYSFEVSHLEEGGHRGGGSFDFASFSQVFSTLLKFRSCRS